MHCNTTEPSNLLIKHVSECLVPQHHYTGNRVNDRFFFYFEGWQLLLSFRCLYIIKSQVQLQFMRSYSIIRISS